MDQLSDGGRIDLGLGRPMIEWSLLGRSKTPGQPSGDGYCVLRNEAGILFALTDGEGSGLQAAEASEACLAALRRSGSDFEAMFGHCHACLQGRRGAALILARIDPQGSQLTWAAVGDVDGVLLQQRKGRLTLRDCVSQVSGTLGRKFDRVTRQSVALEGGDMVVLATDGISRTFSAGALDLGGAEAVAQGLMQNFARPNDDCMVLTIARVAP